MTEVSSREVTSVAQPTSESTGAFSFLPRNIDSKFGPEYPAEQELRDKDYLMSLGFCLRVANMATKEAHDRDVLHRTHWNYPRLGVTATNAHLAEGREWGRTESITIEQPGVFRQAAQEGQGLFEVQYRQAAAQLMLRASMVTPEDLAAIDRILLLCYNLL